MKRIIGIDLGFTITYKKEDGTPDVFPDSIRVVNRLVESPETKVVIISKVNEEQKKRAIQWIETFDFCGKTGLYMSDIFFCKERPDKAIIADSLGVTHHIDDRPEVMACMAPNIKKYLFNPRPEDVMQYFNQLVNTMIVRSWLELEWSFFKTIRLDNPFI